MENLQPYQQRYVVEYVENFERTLACKKMLEDWTLDKLTYTPSNSFELSLVQYNHMQAYINTLYFRANTHLKDEMTKVVKEYVENNADKYPHVSKFISLTGSIN